MNNTSMKTGSKSLIDDLNDLLVQYSKLETLTFELLQVNIEQLENSTTKKDAENKLYELASNHIDLDKRIFELKKKLGLVDLQPTEEKESNKS